MKTKLLKRIGLAMLPIIAFATLAFIPSDKTNALMEISYTEETKTYVNIPSGSLDQVDQFDKMDLKQRTERAQITRTITSNNEINLVKVYLTPNPVEEAWQTQIGRFESDGNGTRLYDTEGNLVVSEPLSELAMEMRQEMAEEMGRVEVSFPLRITDAAIEGMNSQENNVSVTTVEGGDLWIVEKSGAEEKSQYKVFTVLESLGNNEYVPVKEVRTEYVNSAFNGACLEYVTSRSYSNYMVNNRSLH